MHRPLIAAGVTIDYVFARADLNEGGQPVGNALTHNGCKALGVTRKIPLKDRALGRSDAEIALDGDWWREATEEQRAALLDHERHHLAPKVRDGAFLRDDLGRPQLQLRKHDYEFGWFRVVAARHAEHSMERQQAAQIMEDAGQYFWPEIADEKTITLETACGREISRRQ
jgi:hypothetical protein